MSTVDEIVSAASKLSVDELLELRNKLEGLEKSLWQTELEMFALALEQHRITDARFDKKAMRRRRPGQ